MLWLLLLLVAAAVMVGILVRISKSHQDLEPETPSTPLLETEKIESSSTLSGGPM
ncbi:hypothetical protein QUF79_09115 [Fictibacillus enclensis]|uniref:hypothetical protein n=1 Tax=Fictibacillus enclensis TaxID=1017270 RepID=UPI0025A2C289|nr:hypothetical protein [Fictibacillus enclensis]MDM5198178.1 hypothetical protein [Fictibacillus enclensis]